MEIVKTVLWLANLLSAVGVIILVLMQHGKGADMGAAFGSGASGSLFGASGSANFLSRTTAILAVVFFTTSLGLSHLSATKNSSGGVMSGKSVVESNSVNKAPSTPVSSSEIPK